MPPSIRKHSKTLKRAACWNFRLRFPVEGMCSTNSLFALTNG